MEATRFNNLLLGLKNSNQLDYQTKSKFISGFANAILTKDLTNEQMTEAFEVIPYAKSHSYDICDNKAKLFDCLSNEPLNSETAKTGLDFINHCINDDKMKACLASFFIKFHYNDKYFDANKKYSNLFYPFVNAKSLTTTALNNIKADGNSSLTLKNLEFFCKLAEETDQDGMGCILKAIHSDYFEWPVDPLAGIEKTKTGRQLLKRLFLRLCEYKPMEYPGDNWKKLGYDFDKRFAEGVVYNIKNMLEKRVMFEESYIDLRDKVVKAFMSGGGTSLFIAIHFYDNDWYIKELTKELKEAATLNVNHLNNVEMRDKGAASYETLKNFITETAKFSFEESGRIVNFVIANIAKKKKKEIEKLLPLIYKSYISKKGVSWKTFADKITEYDNISKLNLCWEPIIETIVSKKSFSGKDFDMISRIHSYLNIEQKNSIKERLERITTAENECNWSKLYSIFKLYNIDFKELPDEITANFKLMEIADEF